MKLITYRDELTGTQIWTFIINYDERIRVDLDSIDRYMLDECSVSEASIADQLLGLELLARRIEEQTKKGAVEGTPQIRSL